MTDIVPDNLLKEINLLAHTGGVPEFARDRLKALHKAVREAAAEIDRLRAFVDFVNLWVWRESKCSDTERLSVISCHPTAKARRAALNEHGSVHK